VTTQNPSHSDAAAIYASPSLARACFGFVFSTTLVVISMVAVAAA
jgi:hypothetical protein